MSTKKKSKSIKFLESITKESLSLANLLESIRLGEEETQANFAEKLGISRSHLCDIEKGRKSVSVARAAEFANILGYSQEQFVRLSLQDEVNKAGLELLKVKIEVA